MRSDPAAVGVVVFCLAVSVSVFVEVLVDAPFSVEVLPVVAVAVVEVV